MKMLMGSETEWPIIVRKEGVTDDGFFMLADRLEKFYSRCIGPPLFLNNVLFYDSNLQIPFPTHVFLSNGARLYLDTGAHIEYATQEALGPLSLVKLEKAGDRIVQEGVRRANAYWADEGLTFQAYKSNVDTRGNTWGSHESYCIKSPDLTFGETLTAFLGMHLASRQLYTGNGYAVIDRGKIVFSLSQRALKMDTGRGGATTSNRAVVSTRDEPLANSKKYRRIHLICGDALLFQPALLLKYGTTAMVLDLFFSGWLDGIPLEVNPDTILFLCKEFSRPEMLRGSVSINSKRYSLINVQEVYRNLAGKFYETERDMTAEDRKIFSLWDEVLEAAKDPEPQVALSPWVEWAAKKVMIERDMERRKYSWNTPEMKIKRRDVRGGTEREISVADHVLQIHLQFHQNHPDGTAMKLMEAKESKIEKLVSDEDITRAMTVPDQTRAYARHLELLQAKAMAEAAGKSFRIFIDHQTWSHVAIGDADGKLVKKFRDEDPYNPEPHETKIPETN